MADFEKAFGQLKATLPADCISTDRDELITHGSSSWTYHDPKVLPGAVLYPRHTEDVSGLHLLLMKGLLLTLYTFPNFRL
jgi:hypothetical protein